MSMKTKNIIIMALAATLLTACKDKTYKPPTLDAMLSADKARVAWAREADVHSAIKEAQMNTSPKDSIAEDSVISYSSIYETEE